MKRRTLLRKSLLGLTVSLAGCKRSTDKEQITRNDLNKILSLHPTIQKTADGWLLNIIVRNEYPMDTSIHNIRVLTYTADGNKAGEAQVGDLIKPTGDKKIVEITCPEFPAIITTVARETPCEDAFLPVLWWIGTDAQRKQTVAPDEQVWKSTYRNCGEKLLPERVLDQFRTSTTGK